MSSPAGLDQLHSREPPVSASPSWGCKPTSPCLALLWKALRTELRSLFLQDRHFTNGVSSPGYRHFLKWPHRHNPVVDAAVSVRITALQGRTCNTEASRQDIEMSGPGRCQESFTESTHGPTPSFPSICFQAGIVRSAAAGRCEVSRPTTSASVIFALPRSLRCVTRSTFRAPCSKVAVQEDLCPGRGWEPMSVTCLALPTLSS